MPACHGFQRLGWTVCTAALLAAQSYGSEKEAADDCQAPPPPAPAEYPQGAMYGAPYAPPWAGRTYGGGPFPPHGPHAQPQPPRTGYGGSFFAPDSYGSARPDTAAFRSQWFRRPYPYHLDYYRMRYGGSYAPYFGNIYGPPVLFFAPPYPYYGTPYFR